MQIKFHYFLLLAVIFILSKNPNVQASVNLDGNPGKSLDSCDKSRLNWFNLDPKLNSIQGVSVDRAYAELLKNKTPKKKIVVAIIDGGVDIYHEDLKGKIWTNTKEIENNGIDDDKNGYIDDIHGWNFLGNPNGEMVSYENLEYTRIYRKLDPDFAHFKSPNDVPESKKEEYNVYLSCKTKYEKELAKYQQDNQNIKNFEQNLNYVEKELKSYLNKDNLTINDIKAIKSNDKAIKSYKDFYLEIYKKGFTHELLDEWKDQTQERLNKGLNLEFNPRAVIKDNADDINDKHYGNNNIKGSTCEHGTFVAGIIGANRSNNIGIDGIAENVEFMIIRTIPQGDEYDKDVALAIRYAVDNGAQIINMSFGKDYSPQKKFVDDAVRYAEAHQVLLVHAAGNNGENCDVIDHYPTNKLNDNTITSNWITVGASDTKNNKNFVGSFSNYGKKTVDLFAPGVDILSLYPENTYKVASGTSFSSPVVAGVAALVWSYYPELTLPQLKEILLKSSTPYKKLKVYLPTEDPKKKTKVKFSDLSQTGGVVNAYNAIQMADQFTHPQK